MNRAPLTTWNATQASTQARISASPTARRTANASIGHHSVSNDVHSDRRRIPANAMPLAARRLPMPSSTLQYAVQSRRIARRVRAPGGLSWPLPRLTPDEARRRRTGAGDPTSLSARPPQREAAGPVPLPIAPANSCAVHHGLARCRRWKPTASAVCEPRAGPGRNEVAMQYLELFASEVRSRAPGVRHALAMMLPAVIALVMLTFHPLLIRVPGPPFILGILIIGWCAGRGPGLLASVSSVMLLHFLYASEWRLHLAHPDLPWLLLFGLTGIAVAWWSDALWVTLDASRCLLLRERRARDAATAAAAALDQRLLQQAVIARLGQRALAGDHPHEPGQPGGGGDPERPGAHGGRAPAPGGERVSRRRAHEPGEGRVPRRGCPRAPPAAQRDTRMDTRPSDGRPASPPVDARAGRDRAARHDHAADRRRPARARPVHRGQGEPEEEPGRPR